MDRIRNSVEFLTGNHILNAAVLAFLSAQLIKFIIELLRGKKLDVRRLLGAGGMPSSHSSTVVALTVSVGKICGLNSPEFAISAVFAFIVMYDAANVRRAAGEQAKILNYMIHNWNDITPEIFGRELKELLGHTPLQVFAGAALGLALGLLL
ncbi:membrane protein [Clostridia bacterium]|nr:membrane protein [Clostridia bacterium]GHV32783.1 membrane protein [Clostridia bacterium]